MPLPEAFKPQIRQSYPELKPLVVADADASAVLAALETLARNREGWEVTVVDARAGASSSTSRVQGVATTRLLRFKDDFVFRVKPSEEERNVVIVDGRSRSRLGKGDLGANAARLESFLADLKKALPPSTSPSS